MRNVVPAGLAVVSALEAPNQRRTAAIVGIATGTVVVGELSGTVMHADQRTIGGAPNLAARLQEIAQPDCCDRRCHPQAGGRRIC